MIKNFLKTSGAALLSETEQKAIMGSGTRRCCEYDYNANGVLVCTLWVSGSQQCP